ncbi:F-box domain containing protein [Paraphaeosphaeria sporulosa]
MGRSEAGVVDPAARDKYRLQVTAGHSYDTSTHREVAVNSGEAHLIENDLMSCWLKIQIKDYNGLPHNSPETSDYFQHPLHTSDRYSIGFSFVPKRDIKGSDLVTGFDFDHSIKDRLPPGFRYAMRIVTTILDPGIYSDPYSNKPYLYGPALSSFFAFRIGEHTSDVPAEKQLASFESDAKGVIEEGAHGSGQRIRADCHIPAKTSKRRKNFLDEKKLEKFTFEAGRMYQADFFNPYLDFANFALRIPGFSISVVKYIDDKTHQLRYVLKDRSTEEVLFVVIFTLLFGRKLEETLEGTETEHGTTQEVPIKPEHETPERHASSNTSSPYETSTPSSRSRSSSAATSDYEDERETRQDRPTAAAALANSIYSGFAALGFGRAASTSTYASSKSGSPERSGKTTATPEKPKTLDEKVDEMDDHTIEELLKDKHSSV